MYLYVCPSYVPLCMSLGSTSMYIPWQYLYVYPLAVIMFPVGAQKKKTYNQVVNTIPHLNISSTTCIMHAL